MNDTQVIAESEIDRVSEKITRLRNNIEKVIFGKSEVISDILLALFSGGHVLMEDVPGVGKTSLAKSLALSLSADYKRVQFTPDLLPADITGVSIYQPDKKNFQFSQGPIFTNILLADEINRASPRTQSSLLEAMSENQVSVDGATYPLPTPFFVIATQNPVEYHGTYPLPEAQMDRFAIQIGLGYPDQETEISIFHEQINEHPIKNIQPILGCEDIHEVQEAVKKITVKRVISEYITQITSRTRDHTSLTLGVSPRGALMLFRMAQARALLEKRSFCIPDDVKALAKRVLSHRIMLDTKSRYGGLQKETVIEEILQSIPVPI
jgi:MoxR-like ATPase